MYHSAKKQKNCEDYPKCLINTSNTLKLIMQLKPVTCDCTKKVLIPWCSFRIPVSHTVSVQLQVRWARIQPVKVNSQQVMDYSVWLLFWGRWPAHSSTKPPERWEWAGPCCGGTGSTGGLAFSNHICLIQHSSHVHSEQLMICINSVWKGICLHS